VTAYAPPKWLFPEPKSPEQSTESHAIPPDTDFPERNCTIARGFCAIGLFACHQSPTSSSCVRVSLEA
jgi:hypothetical protein